MTTQIPTAARELVVVSGLAGAGKTTAARALEDLGFFVVDNLPPSLIESLASMADKAGDRLRRLAFVVDVREASFLDEFPTTWDRLRKAGYRLRLLFLDSPDDVLVRRFQETRRRHPLQAHDDDVLDAIRRERALLQDVSVRADAIIDTRGLSVHELKRLVVEHFSESARSLGVTLLSFGFKHGLPPELDVCFDARFLPNPYFVEGLRARTGRDEEVARYVMQHDDATAFLTRLEDLVTFLLPRFEREGKSYVTVAIGCTGGRHRSPTLVENLATRLHSAGHTVKVRHRDIERH